jgi:hypothetical protein
MGISNVIENKPEGVSGELRSLGRVERQRGERPPLVAALRTRSCAYHATLLAGRVGTWPPSPPRQAFSPMQSSIGPKLFLGTAEFRKQELVSGERGWG